MLIFVCVGLRKSYHEDYAKLGIKFYSGNGNTMEVQYSKFCDKSVLLDVERIGCDECQRYCPLLDRFFALNSKNWNNIAFYTRSKLESIRPCGGDYEVSLTTDMGSESRTAFIKYCPLLDPVHFLVGKYGTLDPTKMSLPQLGAPDIHPKLADPNNSAYVDSFASYLCSQLAERYGYQHVPEFFGSFTAKKKSFGFTMDEDTDYIADSEFFQREEGNLFTWNNTIGKLGGTRRVGKPLLIGELITQQLATCDEGPPDLNLATGISSGVKDERTMTRSSSSCSSRTSNTCSSSEESDDDTSVIDDCEDNIRIKSFPVHIVAMEKCTGTFDELLLRDELPAEEILAALAQIVFALAGLQKALALVHNDLHTNNVMYVETDKQYLYYKYLDKCWRVPTNGRIYKIIDYGRAIYTYKGRLVCSDSFDEKGDAASQYNTEPFFDAGRKRIDPNQSFDICRLACSMCDFHLDGSSQIRGLIDKWCQDDRGRNMMYKSNGKERYPDFKLYKMITRCVSKHTPHMVISSGCFSDFVVQRKKVNGKPCFNIDQLPSLTFESLESGLSSESV